MPIITKELFTTAQRTVGPSLGPLTLRCAAHTTETVTPYTQHIFSPKGKKRVRGRKHRIWRKENPCTHWVINKPHGCRRQYSVDTGKLNSEVLNYVNESEIGYASCETYARSQAYIGLDFQENDSFELIPFLFDLDGTMATFTTKFWKELSYGSWTWGVAPLVQDINGLLHTVNDLSGGLVREAEKLYGKRITRRIPFKYDIAQSAYGTLTRHKGHLTISGFLRGNIMPSNPKEAFFVFLDELGIHPDLKTIWDVLPLSFVVDYFLPIGDFLESLHPRGWFRPEFSLTGGGYSVRSEFSIQYVNTWKHGLVSDGSSGKFYKRVPNYNFTGLPSRRPVQPEWQCPNIKQLFNTAYLMTPAKTLNLSNIGRFMSK